MHGIEIEAVDPRPVGVAKHLEDAAPALPKRPLEARLTRPDFSDAFTARRASSAQRTTPASRCSSGADQRAEVHEREQTIASAQWAGETRGHRLRLAIAQRGPRGSLTDPTDVDVDADRVGIVVDLGPDRTRGVAADSRELGEIVGPTVRGNEGCGLPQPPSSSRITESTPRHDHVADRSGGGCLHGWKAREELRPCDGDARNLGLGEHHFGNQHTPTIASVTPREIVTTVLDVPAFEGRHGPATVVLVVAGDVVGTGVNTPTVMVTVAPSAAVSLPAGV